MSTHSISPGKILTVPITTIGLPRRWLVETIREWRRRIASRREFAALTALDVRDLGYPAGLEAEISKRFWEN
jgi:uncharacterized protein YjiS (DUF1127 family)